MTAPKKITVYGIDAEIDEMTAIYSLSIPTGSLPIYIEIEYHSVYDGINDNAFWLTCAWSGEFNGYNSNSNLEDSVVTAIVQLVRNMRKKVTSISNQASRIELTFEAKKGKGCSIHG